MSRAAEKRAKTFIVGGFFAFILTVASCFVTLRFLVPDGQEPQKGLLWVFALMAIGCVLLELIGMVLLIRSARRK